LKANRTARYAALLIWSLIVGPAAHADLLDDEEPAVIKPSTSTGNSTATSTATSTGKDKSDGKKPQAETTIKEPVPHTKGTVPAANTSIIPPKKPQSKSGKKKDKEPVHFESKGLKGLREKGMVELIQDVVVTQGDMKMEADHAQVFFDEASHEVQKVVAEGNVKIHGIDENSGEKFRAYGNQAVFLNKERTVVLEGNAKLWRGEDSVIRSKKITYEMDTGWIKADRVAGELAPGDKGK
jgi:lipopolysaccharide transport protein LptA